MTGAATTAAAAPRVAGLEGTTVLLAEDEAVVAFELAVTLRGFGCAVLGPVASATEALGLLRRRRPDIALLDVGLRDGPTTPVAEALAAAGVPFVLVTGYEAIDLEDPLLRAAPFLTKPYHTPDLWRALVDALRPAVAAA